jgi:prolipoprotein diacylglyceryltransferase
MSINELIQYCDSRGWGTVIYDWVVILAFVVQFVFLFFYRKQNNFSLKEAAITVSLVYPVAYFWMLVLAWVENGFTNWGANNIVRVYVYIPLIAIPVAKILKCSAGKVIDYVAPSLALQQVIGHSVCPFAGCCHGYYCEWGIWNPVMQTTLFPIQWVECLVALAIVIFLVWYAKKERYAGKGMVYAMFLVTFGSTRFFLEFLRDNDKLILGISGLAFHALFMTVVGLVWMAFIDETEKQKKKKQKRR